MVQSPLIPLESIVVDPGGFRWIVGGVTTTSGGVGPPERYYFLRDPEGCVSLVPALDVEKWERA